MSDSLKVELVETVVKELLSSGEVIIVLAAISIIPTILGFKSIWNMFKGSKTKSTTPSTVNVNTSDQGHVCNNHAALTTSIGALSGTLKSIWSEITGLKSGIDELGLWIQKKDSESVTNMKRKTIMRSKVIDVLSMFWDKEVKEFAVAKATIFIKFTLDNQEILKQENGYELFKEMFKNEGKGVYSLAEKIMGKAKADEFYDNCHSESIKDYLRNVKKIYEDETNDKTNRYFNQSILFMQEFLAHLNKLQQSKPDNYSELDKSEIVKAFKDLEKKYIKLEESVHED